MREASKKILYIEDDHETAALIGEELADRGFNVQVAYNGREGFSTILKWRPDLVLCDISMPAVSGFEVLERLTVAAPRFWHMPFIFLTAVTDRDVELTARRLGADDFITKPVDFDVLEAIVIARLARVARGVMGEKPADLSRRELEVLTWAARGKTSAETAIILDLSKRTIDFHFDNARMKLGAASRTDAVMRAVTAGWIDL